MNERLNLHKSAFFLAAISLQFLLHLKLATLEFLLDRMVGAVSHSNIFLCNSMQPRKPQTVVRKRKLRALTCKGRNGSIWEHLDGRMELLGHLH